MRRVGCLMWGHRWKRRRREDGVYLFCTNCGMEKLDDTPTSFGTGGAEYLSGDSGGGGG